MLPLPSSLLPNNDTCPSQALWLANETTHLLALSLSLSLFCSLPLNSISQGTCTCSLSVFWFFDLRAVRAQFKKPEMGVPSFYRWLVEKYPKIVVNAVEEADCVDSSRPNPNGFEFDNLYLDMNGIIHPCFHPEEQLMGPTTFDEVFASIFEYVDRIFKIIRPRKLLYMAIDGVAPRAKMNQQRARRFKTAKEAELADAEEERLRKEFESAGKKLLPKEENEVSDSNVITPGTVFMDKLAKALEQYVRLRLNTDPGWKSIMVILSDSNVPGEGEHKIMSFIRLQRSLPCYNPNTRHCLYGLDADLIMLALATHELYFSILREDVIKRGQDEFSVASLSANFSRMELDLIKSRKWFPKVFAANSKIPKKPYQFLNVWTLRECLELDIQIVGAPFDVDFERIVDDFIFICFLTGNDFLPHLATLEIREGAIDLLISVYKNVFRTNGGYLIDTSRIKEKKAAYIKLKRVERFILEVGSHEDKIFKKRYNLCQKRIERLLNQKVQEERNDFDKLDDVEHGDSERSLPPSRRDNKMCWEGSSSSKGSETSESSDVESIERNEVLQNTKELMQMVKDYLRNTTDLFKNGDFNTDKVKLGSDTPDGWKTRYYKEKFSAGNPAEIENNRKKIVGKYVEGLCWVLHYYFAGVRSWSWYYYPFYHGPFASDFRGLVCPPTEFKTSKPFRPFVQLMAVLPPRSSNALPEAYRELMTSEDSTLSKYYPQDFVVDTEGMRFAWQGVCKLPFIDEGELLTATQMKEKDLEDTEVDRNSIKHARIFVRESHALGHVIASIQKTSKDCTERKETDANGCDINGVIEDCVLSAVFEKPDYHDHIPRLLGPPPEKTITAADIMERKLWHEFENYRQPTSTNHYRYARATEDASKSVPENAREKWVSAGSGWSGRGRGRGEAAAESSCGSSIVGGNFGKGRGFVDQHRPFRAQGHSVGRGYQSAEPWQAARNLSGLGRGNGEFQQSARGLVDRSESWRERSTAISNSSRGRGRSVTLSSNQRWNYSADGGNRW